MASDSTRATRTSATRPAPAGTLPVEGPSVLERYRLAQRLGTGAFGTVWMARDERLERDVAVKILARGLVVDGRFEREARAAARLSHPGIVTLYEAEVDDEGAYLVSELVLGRTLDALLADGELSDREVVEIGIVLCDALAHAHEQGVVHRDVKPSNVLVPDARKRSSAGAAKLTDFGVARVIDSDSLTQTGDIIGTLAYMAPEQAAGLEAGEPADLYSLALVLYEALSGVNPLRAASASVRTRRLAVNVPPLRRQRRDIPPELARAIDTALRPRIDERGTLADLRDSLAFSVHAVDDEPGIIAGAFDRTREDDAHEDGPGGRLWWSRGGETVAQPRRRGRPAPEPDPEPADSSRLIWQARALGALGAAVATAWLAHRVIGPGGTFAAPLTLTALVAAGVVLLLPRLGWLAVIVYLCAGAAIAGHPGAALILGAGACVPIVLLPASPSLWPVAAAAPALGLIGLAGAWPALAGWARSPWRRAMLGATGWVWTLLIGVIGDRTLYLTTPRAVAPRGQWFGSVTSAAEHVLEPLVRSGALAPLVVWAVAAVLVPWLTSRRVRSTGGLILDAIRVIVWAVALTAAVGPVILAVTRSPLASTGLSVPSAVGGAIAAAVLAFAPAAVRQMRANLRARGYEGAIP